MSDRSMEAELAEMRQERDAWKREAESHIEVMNKATNRIGTLQHELADLRASLVELQIEFDAYREASVVWRVRCPCVFSSDPSTTPNCPDCVNGWRLVEGVRKITPAVKVYDKIIGDYVIPARLIEGDA